MTIASRGQRRSNVTAINHVHRRRVVIRLPTNGALNPFSNLLMPAEVFSLDGYQIDRRAKHALDLILCPSTIFVQMMVGSFIPL